MPLVPTNGVLRRCTTAIALCICVMQSACSDSPSPPRKRTATVQFAVHRASWEEVKDWSEQTDPATGRTFYLDVTPIVMNADVVNAKVGIYMDGTEAIDIFLTSVAGDRMQIATQSWQKKPFAVLIDGKITEVATVMAAFGQAFQIRHYPEETRIASAIAAGIPGWE